MKGFIEVTVKGLRNGYKHLLPIGTFNTTVNDMGTTLIWWVTDNGTDNYIEPQESYEEIKAKIEEAQKGE